MKWLIRITALVLGALLAMGIWLAIAQRNAPAQEPTPPVPESDEAIREAVDKAVEANEEGVLGFMINDIQVNEIFYSDDGQKAVVWLAQVDPDTGEVLGTEPGLAVATNRRGLLGGDNWDVDILLEQDPAELLDTLPSELLTEDLLERYASSGAEAKAVGPFTGYKLPWSSALNIKITGSIGHFKAYNSCSEASCRYAYDFWNPDAGNRMFPILAAKGGIVWAWKESCNNGDTSCSNYIVLKDDSTTPSTYQLYYHIAKNSVPDNFVAQQTYIPQGGYIGNVDDTGASSDHHLHFHVYVTPPYAGYYGWGNSVQIKFSDVPFNGGEPRTCAETQQWPSYGTECSMGPDGKKGGSDDNYLISQNVGANPPTGSLTSPAADATITTTSVVVEGTASDNLGITKVQVLGNYDGTWVELGQANHSGSRFTKTIDFCTLGIPNGPMSLAVRIWDVEGNWAGRYTGLRQIYLNTSCGGGTVSVVTPACTPGDGQVGVYSEPDLGGSCLKLNRGTINASALGSLNNKIQSIQVSSNTCATLYDRDGADMLGRSETITATDYNLADNIIGANRASSLVIQQCTANVDEPFLIFPGNQYDPDGNSRSSPNPPSPTSADSLVLAWTGGEGSLGFTSSLIKGGQTVKSMGQTVTNSWSVGTLLAGAYTWRVTAIGPNSGTNNTELDFTVAAGSLPSVSTVTAPKTFDMEDGGAGWTGTGLWKAVTIDRPTRGSTKAWAFTSGSTFNDATYKAGDLTSPPISIPSSGTYYLRFDYFSDVEGWSFETQRIASQWYDQRRVQVSIDNGVTFTDLYQVNEDSQGIVWMKSPAISLSAYAGKTIRLRWHFDAVDNLDNAGYGWAIDDVRIDTTAPESCSDSNNSPATAESITVDGAWLNGTICPGGDSDYFRFTAQAGTPVRINLDARTLNPVSALDSFIAVLDSNGRDVLALNDDEDPGNTVDAYRDSLLSFVVPRTGTYYVRVRAWDHPGAGGSGHTYRIGLSKIGVVRPTSVTLRQPRDPKKVAISAFIVEAGVVDDTAGGGIRQVDFYWHSADWQNGNWIKFATDTTPADGWWAIFDPSMNNTLNPLNSLPGSAFYIMATNNGGGVKGLLVKDLQPDLTLPDSVMNSLPASVNSTAVQLSWTAQDVQNDIDYFEIQYRVNGGSWTLWDTRPTAKQRSAWFLGSPGNYEFRMQAVDQAGNQEGFPPNAEAAVTLNGTCTDDQSDQTRPAAKEQTYNTSAEHRLCQNDEDWIKVNLEKDQTLSLFLASKGGGAAVRVRLYDSGSTPLLDQSSRAIGAGTVAKWTAPSRGTYYVQITPMDARLYGQDVVYLIYLGEPHEQNMPVISP